MIVQLTDPHLGADWSDDPAAALARVVDAVPQVLREPPAAVILTGDVANTPARAEYEQARRALDRLQAPVYAVPGNHDDRDDMRRAFDLPVTEGGLVCYAVEAGPIRLIGLDTQVPGSDAGQLDAAQLVWLEEMLALEPTRPTLIAMHHPPLLSGIRTMDALAIDAGERAGLRQVLNRHLQVHVIACGHVHRTVFGTLGGAGVLALPSTDVQLRLELDAETMSFVREPPCFALHMLVGERIVSHIQPV